MQSNNGEMRRHEDGQSSDGQSEDVQIVVLFNWFAIIANQNTDKEGFNLLLFYLLSRLNQDGRNITIDLHTQIIKMITDNNFIGNYFIDMEPNLSNVENGIIDQFLMNGKTKSDWSSVDKLNSLVNCLTRQSLYDMLDYYYDKICALIAYHTR